MILDLTSVYNYTCSYIFYNKKRGFFYRYFFSLPYKILKGILKFYIRNCYKYFIKIKEGDSVQTYIIASLTTYPARINTLHLTLKTIINQSYKPKKIIIWLTLEEFPNQQEDVPTSIKELFKYGVEVIFVEKNLKPHNKYYYAFNKFPHDIIITFDDDVFYLRNTIEHLVHMHKKYPHHICTNICREVGFHGNEFISYRKWKTVISDKFLVSNRYMPLGYAGVLYPPNVFDKRLFDIELISKLSPKADDLWLKACSLLKNTLVVYGGSYFPKPLSLTSIQSTGLHHYNEGEVNANDIQWMNICNNLNITPDTFK